MLKKCRFIIGSLGLLILCQAALATGKSLQETTTNPNPVFEIVTWQAKEGVSDEAIIKAVDEMVSDLKKLSGFLHQSLYKNAQGEWVDIYYWETEQDAHNSNTSMAEKASFTALIDLIKADTVTIEVMSQLQTSGKLKFD